MKSKMSAVIILFSLSLNLNTNTYSKTLAETEQVEMDVESVKQHKHKGFQKYLNKLSLKLKSELDQIENPRERKIVKKLIQHMQASGYSAQNVKDQQHINQSFKNTIHLLADRLTSPHAIVSIAIATTTCALKGILTSSIALQIIHELVSAYKWDIASRFCTRILSFASSILYLKLGI